jgi:hypothetical protein
MFPKKGALVPEIRFIGFTELGGERDEGSYQTYHGNWIESNHIFEKIEYRQFKIEAEI